MLPTLTSSVYQVLSISASAGAQVMSTINTAASTAYNALDNLGSFVSDTLTGQASAAQAQAQASAAQASAAQAQAQAPAAQAQASAAQAQASAEPEGEIQPSILEVVEEEKEEGEEKPEESNKKVITI